MRLSPTAAATAMALILALAASAATARSLGQIARGTGLSPDDFTLMDEAAQSLYVARAPEAGTEATWQNPDTGASGRVVVTGVSGACVSLDHRVQPGGNAPVRRIPTRRCRTADGAWVLQAE